MRKSCKSSGGKILIGLNSSGEYVEYTAKFWQAEHFRVLMVCRGEIGEEVQLTLKAVMDPLKPSADVSFRFLGAGFG